MSLTEVAKFRRRIEYLAIYRPRIHFLRPPPIRNRIQRWQGTSKIQYVLRLISIKYDFLLPRRRMFLFIHGFCMKLAALQLALQ